MEALLAAGCDPEPLDCFGRSPLEVARVYAHECASGRCVALMEGAEEGERLREENERKAAEAAEFDRKYGKKKKGKKPEPKKEEPELEQGEKGKDDAEKKDEAAAAEEKEPQDVEAN